MGYVASLQSHFRVFRPHWGLMNIATFPEPMALKVPFTSPFISFLFDNLSRCGNQNILLSPPPIISDNCDRLQQIICDPLFLVTMNTTALLSLIYPCDPGVVVDTPVSWHPSYNLNLLPHTWEACSVNTQGVISFVFLALVVRYLQKS